MTLIAKATLRRAMRWAGEGSSRELSDSKAFSALNGRGATAHRRLLRLRRWPWGQALLAQAIVSMRLARLHEGSLVLSRWRDGQLAGDFRLRLSTPEGEETWTLGPGLFGSVDEFVGKGLAFFEFQLRSWFEDHIPDPDRAPAGPDRAYDELPVSHDVPADLRRIVEGDPPAR